MSLFRFDTRDTKPKLFNLLFLTVLFAAAVVLPILFGVALNAGALCLGIAAYCFLSVLILLYSFREQIRYNPYSYNTIIYCGFALFVCSVAVTFVRLALRIFRFPELYTKSAILFALLHSAKNYMLLSFPFLLIFSAALCLSNLFLIRHEGKRPVNLLGILLSVLILAGEAFIFVFDDAVSDNQPAVMIRTLVTNLVAAVFLYFECLLIGTIVADAIAATHEPSLDKDFIILLGCGLKKDGAPTPLLRGRLDRALSFYEKQKKKTGKEATFITSGGRGEDEPVSESCAMKRYLIEHGVPEDRILEESRSATTFENMKFSKALIDSIDPAAKIAFSTTNYHVFRSGLWARRVKMRAVGMGAKTKWYFWPNAAVREFAGLLTNHRGKQAAILGSVVILYVVLTFAAYF